MPSLQDLMNIAQVAGPIAGGAINSAATSGATGNLVQGSQQAQTTITDAQKAAQQAIQNEQNQNNQTLAPFQPGGSAATGLQAANAALLQPYQDAGTDALKKATAMTTPGSGYQIQQDPSYQWRLQQGEAAINAGANAGGVRFSGATLKSLNDYAGNSASQEFQNEFGREMGLVGVGQNAANEGVGANLSQNQQSLSAAQTQVGANVQVGNQTVTLDTQTAEAIANLQQQAAEARARGDVAQGNNISSTINSILQGLTNKQGMSALQNMLSRGGPSPVPGDPGFVGPVQGPGNPGFIGPVQSGLTEAGTAAGVGADVAAGAVPEIGSLGATGAGAAGAATSVSTLPGAAAAAGDAGAGGIMSSIGAFMTNPITIGIAGAALGAYALIKHFQVHQTADKWVQGVQNPFDKQMGSLNDGFFKALQSGTLTKDQATQIRNTVKNISDQYEAGLQTFGKKGSKEATVAKQAQQTADQWYGPGFSKTLNAMDSAIQGMAA